jgi:tetratricopeptide (TPR) repeat protein
VRTRARFAVAWSATQDALGSALKTWGDREGSLERWDEAVTAFRAALEVPLAARTAVSRELMRVNLANALWTLGDRRKNPALLQEAATAYRGALDVFQRAGAVVQARIARRALQTLEEHLATYR